jgi:DNA-binding response OmpR family regulator
MNILVADTGDSTVEPLRRAGCVVTVARSGREAGTLIETHSFDGVVLGLIGSENESLTVCRELREQHSSVPIVILVPQNTIESRVQGLDAGADYCVPLSGPVEELLARLRAIVRRTSRLDAS